MAQITNEEINQIQKSADIVEIIGSYIDLEKKGKNFMGVCPFHDDHSPSMSVSREKGIYTCFTCHSTGNVFRFIQDYENISFIEAVKKVADHVGIEINADFKSNSKYEAMYDAYDLAIKFYQNNLKSKAGHAAHEYLNKRGLSDEIIDEFEIGYASSESDTLTKLLTAKEFDEEVMINSGLVNRGKSLYDLFRDRITFPIHNANGRPVAFSARIYEKKDNEAKYINTKETPIFKKGEILFNFHRARNEAKRVKKLIIVEGQMDAIRVYASGVKNVVATMGTALTEDHIKLLSRLNVEIVLCFDNDGAGEKATLAVGDLLEQSGISPTVVRLSGEKDPDEYILAHGVEGYLDAINNGISLFEFKRNVLGKDKDFTNARDISSYVKSVLTEINKSDDEVFIEAAINNLSKETGISVDTLKKQLDNMEKPIKLVTKKNVNIVKSQKKLKYEEKLYEKLIFYMLSDENYIKLYEQELSYINEEKYAAIVDDILAFFLKYNYINIANFLVDERDSEYIEDIMRIIDSNIEMELIANDFVGIIEKIKKSYSKDEFNKNMGKMNTTNKLEQRDLFDKLLAIKKKEV